MISGIPNCLNYCKIFIIRTKFGNVALGRITQPKEPRDRHQTRKSTTKNQRFKRTGKKGEFSLWTVEGNKLYANLMYFPLQVGCM